MYWDLLKTIEWVLYSLIGTQLGYRLRTQFIPRLLKHYQLVPKAWYWHYPLFERLGIFFTITLTFQSPAFSFFSLAVLIFIWLLLILVFIDMEHLILPDILIGALWICGCLVNIYNALFVKWYIGVLSSIVAYFSLWLFSSIYAIWTGRIGLGRGDIKLFGMLGTWFGGAALPIILWIASVSGLCWALIGFYLKRQAYYQPIPFGPFLAFGAWCYLIFLTYAPSLLWCLQ